MDGESYILRRLDDPWTLGLWELDVALPFSACLFLGMVRGTFTGLLVAVCLGFFLARRISQIKAARHPRFFLHLLYWLLPPAVLGSWARRIPPSAQHEMVG